MLAPVNWLKEYVNTDSNSREIAEAMTLSGSHVESLIRNRSIDKLVVGEIKSIKNHPDADKLVVCKVDTGFGEVQIVTGAPNVEENILVAVALEGSILPNGLEIKASELRGVESQGMLCSYEELGFSDSVVPRVYRDGILVFNDDFDLGTSVFEALGMDGDIIEFEITPNRPDCLSIIGLSRELAATEDKNLELPESYEKEDNSSSKFGGVDIQTEKCSACYLRVIEDVEIKESPNWMQNYLMQAGIRPLNNIVDISNFVMLETGQPLHAYDLDKIEGQKLIIRQAHKGETVKNIDGQTRELEEEDIVIGDDQGPIGLAGVMGGYDTEVTESTKRVLIESAIFDKDSIRNTSGRLGLRSEASSRYEKGTFPHVAKFAANRAVYLAEKLAEANPSPELHFQGEEKLETKEITLNPDYTSLLLGVDISLEDQLRYLERLFLEVSTKDGLIFLNTPQFRSDLGIEEDLIEEIGRLYGFHNITPKKISGPNLLGKASEKTIIDDFIKDQLRILGFSEVVTYSFVSPKANDKSGIEGDIFNKQIKITNPLGEEYSVMRTSILPNILEILSRNQKNRIENFSVYEIGNIFFPSEDGYSQEKSLVLGGYGLDFYEFKARVQNLLYSLNLRDVEFEARSDLRTFHPGRCASLVLGGKDIGVFGEISYQVSDTFEYEQRVLALVLDLEVVYPHVQLEKTYSPISKFPSIKRDLSLLLDKDKKAKQIEDLILSKGGGLIKDVRIYDIYQGEQIPEGKKSMTYEITYGAQDRTLKDQEVNEVQEEIIKALHDDLAIEIRK